jgi:MtaA/CmuA family methyltransferase
MTGEIPQEKPGRLSARQRFSAAMRGQPVDRPSAGGLTHVVSFELMDAIGVRFPEANIEPEPMAALAAAAHDVIGFDNVMPIFTVAQEASALGCEVDWQNTDRMPVPTTHPWKDRNAEMSLPVGFPDSFLEDRYVRCALEALRLLKKHFGDEVFVLGKVMGPWTLSYHLWNTQEFLMDTLLDPDRVRRSLDTLKEVPVVFARAQLEVGADAILWADHVTGDLVSSKMYREYLLPLHRELLPQIPSEIILHCCGPTLDRIRLFCDAGFNTFHFESQVQPNDAVAEAAGRMTLAGNINNPVTLYKRGPREVNIEAQRAIDAGVDIIAPECAIPLQTPLENLREIVRTCQVNEYGWCAD